MFIIRTILYFAFFFSLVGCFSVRGPESHQDVSLLAYVGSASRPAMDELTAAFNRKTGIRIDVSYGGSGTVLSQMMLSKKGDLYFPGSSDYMEKAKQLGVVDPTSERIVAFLVPALIVPKENPAGIKDLRDLLKPKVKVALANPESVCLGAYSVEILEHALSSEELQLMRNKVTTFAESCEKTAALITLGSVDGAIGWSVFGSWNPEKIQVIPLRPEYIRRIGYLPIAITRFSKKADAARRFIEYAKSREGQFLFRKHGYFMSAEDAYAYVGEKKQVGGEYSVPTEWTGK